MTRLPGYRYVPARYDFGAGLEPRAIVWHMAEGGNTVEYLRRNPKRRVSVHFVIQADGTTVQMLTLDHISGSLNPQSLRDRMARLFRWYRLDDAPFRNPDGELVRYGASAAKAVLGTGYRDPNRYVISVEVEGFASKGTTPAQRVAAVRLARKLREAIPTLRGNLGHRDFTPTKACPGRIGIPWKNLGGHGRW